MNKIIQILLTILFLQLLIFLYIKFIYEKKIVHEPITTQTKVTQVELDTLVNQSINEIVHGKKELPQSKEYTVWDKKMIAKLNKEIQVFNQEMQKIVAETLSNKTLKSIDTKKEKEPQNKTTVKVAQKKPTKPKISTTSKITEFAKKKLGKEYLWGATGPHKFDCSGFTRDVFKSTTGIQIPRVSRDQAKVGTYVKFSELKRGDMVFFDTEKKYTGKVNHVGIYLSNNNFIHASSARKKVIITNFKKKPFYKKRFLWGRRIVNSAS